MGDLYELIALLIEILTFDLEPHTDLLIAVADIVRAVVWGCVPATRTGGYYRASASFKSTTIESMAASMLSPWRTRSSLMNCAMEKYFSALASSGVSGSDHIVAGPSDSYCGKFCQTSVPVSNATGAL